MKNPIALLCLLLATLWGCGVDERVQIEESREVDPAEYDGARERTAAERLGFSERPAKGDVEDDAASEPAPEPAAESPLAWDAPETWERQPERAMRLATYTTGGCECYITTLSGLAGGVAANINRWRRQMGQPPLSEEELAALPTLNVLGRETPFVTIAGAYTGMSGEERPGYLMYGMVCPLEGETVFAKMIGPEAQMRAEADRFAAFCESLRRQEP